MQSLFLACYLCLQLIAINNHDQGALTQRDTSCDQCVTGLVDKFHLPFRFTTDVEKFLSIKKPTAQIIRDNPALADAIAKLIQEEISAATGTSLDENETQQGQNGFLGKLIGGQVNPKKQSKSFLRVNERLNAEESLVSENQRYLATLNNYGELVLTDADGKFIEKLGCPSSEPSLEYNVLFDSSNNLRFYNKIGASDDTYHCSSGTSAGCSQDGARCYINLDNDGRLRFYNGKGDVEYLYSSLPEQPEQQPPIAEEPKEIEYKGKSILKRNERIKVGEFLVSENGKFKITLNHYGEFETFDSQGKLIRNGGACDIIYYSDDWNWLMDSNNSLKLHRNLNEDDDHYMCATGIPMGPKECYMKLDNDGIMRMYDENGNSILEETYNNLESPFRKKKVEPDLSTEPVYQGRSSLKRNQRLKVGESLVSENGIYKITLNKHGQMETVNSKGKLIRKSDDCAGNSTTAVASDTWNVLMDSDNFWKIYHNMKDAHPVCTSCSSRHCIEPGVVCYLKLDNDGVLKVFDEQGQVELEMTYNALDYNP